MRTIAKLGMALVVVLGAQSAFAMGGSNSSATSKKPAARSEPSLSDAEREVKAKQYRRAIMKLEQVVRKNPRSVDAYNYLGYSHRQLGEYDRSIRYYQTALRLDPNHRGANEYVGQLYLKMGDVRNARRQLAKLRRICGPGCEEHDNLRASIRAARKKR